MPFAYVIQNLRAGQAAKRPAWSGYVKKTVAQDAPEGAYTLTFKKRDGAESVYEVAADGTIAVGSGSSAVSLDVELLASMMSDDWISGDAAAFETARTGAGTW